MIATIALDDGLILPHSANPTGSNFRERQGTAFDDLERDLGIDGRHLTRDQIAEAWASFGAQFMATWTPKRYAEWPWAYREFGDPR
jgi:hypothetical protein